VQAHLDVLTNARLLVRGLIMGEGTQVDSTHTQEEAARKKKEEEDWKAAKWVLGLLFAGAAWVFGKACEWLFGPSEPQAWWVWTKRVYFGGVYTVVAIQVGVALYQLFVLLRDNRKRTAAELQPGQKPTDEWPKDFMGWVKHIALVLVGFIVLAAFAALCLVYGYVIETIKAWFSSWFS
jgi:hypothetical protein